MSAPDDFTITYLVFLKIIDSQAKRHDLCHVQGMGDGGGGGGGVCVCVCGGGGGGGIFCISFIMFIDLPKLSFLRFGPVMSNETDLKIWKEFSHFRQVSLFALPELQSDPQFGDTGQWRMLTITSQKIFEVLNLLMSKSSVEKYLLTLNM